MGFDLSQFLKGLSAAQQKARAAAVRALDKFGEHVIGDAQQMVPVKSGALQGSGTVNATAAQVAAKEPAKIEGDLVSKEIGFNVSYAAAVHENLTAHHEKGQAKFLEAAMHENAPKMPAFVADQIKAAMGGS